MRYIAEAVFKVYVGLSVSIYFDWLVTYLISFVNCYRNNRNLDDVTDVSLQTPSAVEPTEMSLRRPSPPLQISSLGAPLPLSEAPESSPKVTDRC